VLLLLLVVGVAVIGGGYYPLVPSQGRALRVFAEYGKGPTDAVTEDMQMEPLIVARGDVGLLAWTERYIEALRVKNYSPRTLETRENYLHASAGGARTGLPRHVLTETEAEKVLLQPDTSEPLGIRDRAILEVLYSTGIRRMELVNLRVFDLDGERGTLIVRQGKGKRARRCLFFVGERGNTSTKATALVIK